MYSHIISFGGIANKPPDNQNHIKSQFLLLHNTGKILSLSLSRFTLFTFIPLMLLYIVTTFFLLYSRFCRILSDKKLKYEKKNIHNVRLHVLKLDILRRKLVLIYIYKILEDNFVEIYLNTKHDCTFLLSLYAYISKEVSHKKIRF